MPFLFLENFFQSVNQFIQFDHAFTGKTNAWHKALSVNTVMSQCERFSSAAKNNLLMSEESRQTYGVNGNAAIICTARAFDGFKKIFAGLVECRLGVSQYVSRAHGRA